MVAYRRNNSFENILTQTKLSPRTPSTNNDNTKTTIKHLMNNTGSITNNNTGKTLKIEGGTSIEKDIVYAVKCTKHSLIYMSVKPHTN